jgi:hypothetical protein
MKGKNPAESKFRSGRALALPEQFFRGADFNISLTIIGKTLTLFNYF